MDLKNLFTTGQTLPFKKSLQQKNSLPSIDYMVVLNFLENEEKRIEKILNLFHNILPNLESFDQKDTPYLSEKPKIKYDKK